MPRRLSNRRPTAARRAASPPVEDEAPTNTFIAWHALEGGAPSLQGALAKSKKGSRTILKESFYTTVGIQHITNGERQAIVQHVLLDSGAPANFVHRNVVDAFGLEVEETRTPQDFEGSDENPAIHDHKVRFELCLGGLRKNVIAYVDDSAAPANLFIIGDDTLQDYLIRPQIRTAARPFWKHTIVTVAVDVTGKRSERYVVPQDTADLPAECFLLRASDPAAVALYVGKDVGSYDAEQRRVYEKAMEMARETTRGMQDRLTQRGKDWHGGHTLKLRAALTAGASDTDDEDSPPDELEEIFKSAEPPPPPSPTKCCSKKKKKRYVCRALDEEQLDDLL